MKIKKESPILSSSTRLGLAKYWQLFIVTDGSMWYTQTKSWQETKNGGKSKSILSTPYECTPKNIGKKNETTSEEQAYLEFDSILKKQKEKGYSPEGETYSGKLLPMLANKFKDKKHKIIWPAKCQPKYNGMRMLYDGKNSWSRTGKAINQKSIEHLQFDTHGYTIDGELILPGNVLLQQTMEAVKTFTPGVSTTLQYIVYDIVDTKCFSERYEILKTIVKSTKNKHIILSPTYSIVNESELFKFHENFTKKLGYEGTMIRSDIGGYEAQQRSSQLLKYKNFVDDEFRIVDVKDGEGSFVGLAIFKCDNKHGGTFDCTPEGSVEIKKKYFKDRKKLIGKLLTVRYQELSEDKSPLFPVGVTIRDYE